MIAVMMFGLLELSLRLFAKSLTLPLTVEVSADSTSWYQINRGYLQKYFSMNASIVPELKPSLFKKKKHANLFRIMCMGESSMFGTPYQMTCTIPALLRKQLRHAYPDREIEVLNLGASAINSNVILNLSKNIITYEPDLVLLYMGHNDFYGPDGVGASFLQQHFPSTIQWVYELRDFRIIQLLNRLLHSMKPDRQIPADNNLMRQVSQEARISLRSPESERIFNLFESNLRNIIAVFREHHIPLIVSDVTSNLEFPPFIADTLKGVDHAGAFADSIAFDLQHRDYTIPIKRLSAVYRLDSSNAWTNYWLGKTYLGMGDSITAKTFFIAAKDNDLLKFRAPKKINEIIHDVCNNENVPCISADTMFSSLSTYGIPGESLFWEHLHPNAFGYYSIANLFFQKIASLNILGSHSPTTVVPFEADSLSVCWMELAYGDLSIQRLTGQWPFTNYKRTSVVIDSATPPLRQIALDTYTRKLLWDEGCLKSAEYFWKTGSYRNAQTTYEALIEDTPENFYAQYLLGNLFVKTKHPAEAKEHLRRSIQANPRYPNARVDLGLLHINAGEFDEAISDLHAALPFVNDERFVTLRANIYYGLSAAYANKGMFDPAMKNITEALRIVPSYPEARALRNAILEKQTGK
jgi:tetratricopeptide (TPR) repeat protein